MVKSPKNTPEAPSETNEPPLQPLLLTHVERPESVLLLGSLVAKSLLHKRHCAFVATPSGAIEAISPLELTADALPEEEAIALLLRFPGYTDDRLVDYLKARERRNL